MINEDINMKKKKFKKRQNKRGLSFDPTYFIGSDLKLVRYRPWEMEVERRFLH